MNWGNLGKNLASMGLKAIGSVVGGPFGVSAASMLANTLGLEKDATADQIDTELAKASPEIMAKIRELETKVKLANIQAEVDFRNADSTDLKTVNQTMQSESKSEHWAQWMWRPYNGFLFGTTFFCVYFLLPLLKKPIPQIDYTAWIIWGSVLGVTAAGRNALKQAQQGNKKPTIIDAITSRIKGNK